MVAGDFNLNLDQIDKSNKMSSEALKLLISDHSLVDSSRICHSNPSSYPGYTYIDQKSCRIDGNFISQQIANKSFNIDCKVVPKHLLNHITDHKSVNLIRTYARICQIALEIEKLPFGPTMFLQGHESLY